MAKNLDQKVRDLLIARKGDWVTIAEQSNVSYSWLSKFVNGHIDNPGYVTLTDLHVYLTTGKKPKQEA